MTFRILDLDNTISNDGWRIPRIRWANSDPDARYHEYHSLSGFDSAGNNHLFEGKKGVIIFTARPSVFRPITEEWLKRNGINHKLLLMRELGDHRPSVELKLAQLSSLDSLYSIHRKEIALAADDRQDVINMYLEQGLRCAEVHSLHDTCAYADPRGKK